MKVLDTGFARDFIRLCNDGWLAGWHESNGGNASYRLRKSEVNEVRAGFSSHAWQKLDVEVPQLAGEFFLVTAAGSHFRSIAHDPKRTLGIIEVDRSGSAWRVCWGFKGDAQPTSELLAHLIDHEIRLVATDGKNRVIYHCHPANVAAMTNIVPLDSALFTRLLWTQISECAFVFPEGIQIVPWEIPGSIALARRTAEATERSNVVLWPHHGLFVAGVSLDDAFGRAHTVEKAAEIYLKTCMSGRPYLSGITEEDILKMSAAYGLGIDAHGIFMRPPLRLEEPSRGVPAHQGTAASQPMHPEQAVQMPAPVPWESAPEPAVSHEAADSHEPAMATSDRLKMTEGEPSPSPDAGWPVFSGVDPSPSIGVDPSEATIDPMTEAVQVEEVAQVAEPAPAATAFGMAEPQLSAQGFPKLGGPEMTVEAALAATPPAFRTQPIPQPQMQLQPEEPIYRYYPKPISL